MRKQVVAMFMVIGSVALGSGCAKHEVVKSEQPLAPSATVAKPAAPAQSASVQAAPAAVSPVAEQAAAPAPQAAQAAELKASLEKVYFDFDSSSLSQQGRDRLLKNAEAIKKDAAVKVRIEGHCDERGSDEYNLALGEKRARAAERYLVTLGVPAERLSVVSFGKEKPADPGHDAAAWAKNRRDEFVIPER